MQFHYRDSIFKTLLPATAHHLLKRSEKLDECLMPRNVRRSGGHRAIVDNLIRASIPRSRRLMNSIEDLEREIQGSTTRPENEDYCDSYLFSLL